MNDPLENRKFTADELQKVMDEVQRVEKLPKEERYIYDVLLEQSVREKEIAAHRKKYFGPINYFLCVLGVVTSHIIIAGMEDYYDFAKYKADDPISLVLWIVFLLTASFSVAYVLKNNYPRYMWFVGGVIFGVFGKLV